MAEKQLRHLLETFTKQFSGLSYQAPLYPGSAQIFLQEEVNRSYFAKGKVKNNKTFHMKQKKTQKKKQLRKPLKK